MAPALPDNSVKENRSIVMIALILVCLNLRIVFGGVGPLIPYMHLTPMVASILTALPPLCMGLFAPTGAMAARRFGEERALFLSVVILTIGILIRSSSIPGLLAGTVIASIGVAALNVLTPVFIRRHFAPDRIGALMGVYTMMMGAGGGIMAALSVPVYNAAGGSWPIALGVAALPSALAIVALAPLLGNSARPRAAGDPERSWNWLLTHPTAWSIVAFFGIQCLVFYTVLAWLPAIYVSKGVSPAVAGFFLALCIFAVAAGGFFGPFLAARRKDQRLHITACIALCIVGICGVLLAPAKTGWVWSIVLGFGMGAGQGIPGVLYARRTADHAQMAQLSGMVQTFGYLIAAAGPLVTAGLHGWSGGWTWPLGFVLILLVLNGVLSLRGGRDHVIGDKRA